MVYFHPENRGRFLIWRTYFSDGLVQLTNISIGLLPVNSCFHERHDASPDMEAKYLEHYQEYKQFGIQVVRFYCNWKLGSLDGCMGWVGLGCLVCWFVTSHAKIRLWLYQTFLGKNHRVPFKMFGTIGGLFGVIGCPSSDC